MNENPNNTKNLKNFIEKFDEKAKTQEQEELWDIVDKIATNVENNNETLT